MGPVKSVSYTKIRRFSWQYLLLTRFQGLFRLLSWGLKTKIWCKWFIKNLTGPLFQMAIESKQSKLGGSSVDTYFKRQSVMKYEKFIESY